MDFFITFFRDILDGPLYIVVAIISGILICSCIGYLAEQSINNKKQKNLYDKTHANADSNGNKEVAEVVSNNQISSNVLTSQSVQDINPAVTGVPTVTNTTVQVGQQVPINSQNIGQ